MNSGNTMIHYSTVLVIDVQINILNKEMLHRLQGEKIDEESNTSSSSVAYK